MELVGTSRTPIVSMVVFDDRLFVATTEGVFERLNDGKFHELELSMLRRHWRVSRDKEQHAGRQ